MASSLADLAVQDYYTRLLQQQQAAGIASTPADASTRRPARSPLATVDESNPTANRGVDLPINTAPTVDKAPGPGQNTTGTGGTGGTGNTGTGDLASLVPTARTGVGGSGAPGYAYEGYDFAQAATNRDTGQSAKYAWADAQRKAAEQGAGDMWKTKQGAQEMAIKYLIPEVEKNGWKVLEVRGEKVRIITQESYAAGNREGVWIDWVRGADGENPALAWQEESAIEGFGPVDTRFAGVKPTSATTTAGTTGTGTGTKTETDTGATTDTSRAAADRVSASVYDELTRGQRRRESLADLVY